MVTKIEILLRIHKFAQALFDCIHGHVAPDNRYIVHTYNLQEALVLITPRLRNAEGDVHIGLHGHTSCQTETGSTQTS